MDALDVLTDRSPRPTTASSCYACCSTSNAADAGRACCTSWSTRLTDEGALLLSHPVGDDEFWEHTSSGDYRVVRWSSATLDDRLQRAGLTVAWDRCDDGDEGPWRAVLARRRREPARLGIVPGAGADLGHSLSTDPYCGRRPAAGVCRVRAYVHRCTAVAADRSSAGAVRPALRHWRPLLALLWSKSAGHGGCSVTQKHVSTVRQRGC